MNHERLSRDEGRALLLKPKKKAKYRNQKTEWGGMKFDSKREAARAAVLFILQKSGDIKDLKLQEAYFLWHPCAEKPICKYIADFDYLDVATQTRVTEDVKGVETAIFRLKAKLFKANTGREIRIIK